MHIHGALLTYSLISALKVLPFGLATNFGPLENCFAQTVVVAIGSAAVAGGFVGPLLALRLDTGYFPKLMSLDSSDVYAFALPVTLIGVGLALPIRALTHKEHSYPSGTVAAFMLSSLHQSNVRTKTVTSEDFVTPGGTTPPYVDSRIMSRMSSFHTPFEEETAAPLDQQALEEHQQLLQSRLESILNAEANARATPGFGSLFYAALFGASWRMVTYFVPILESLPVLHWAGVNPFRVSDFGWTLYLSPAFWGYGMFVAKNVILSQLLGAITAYMFLGPITAHLNWSQASLIGTHDIEAGPYSFILFSSITVVLTSTAASLLRHIWATTQLGKSVFDSVSDEELSAHSVQMKNSNRDIEGSATDRSSDGEGPGSPVGWGFGLWMIAATVAVVLLHKVFYVDAVVSVSVLIIGTPVSIACVRVLGLTDRNIYIIVAVAIQALLGIVLPGNQVLHILLSGAVGAIAFQAGECIQGYRTGHLLQVPWRAQFHAQIVGAVLSVFITSAIMGLFETAFVIPGPEFPAVEAFVYRGFTHLTAHGFEGLPEHLPFVLAVFAGATWTIESIQNITGYHALNMIAFGMGMYLDPYFTLAPCLGFLAYHLLGRDAQNKAFVGSGLIAGEVLMTVVVAIFTILAVPQLTCAGCTDICCGGPCCGVLSCC
eukprot:c7017_g1_i2.p1 GENE.c7017_g1_i2~~c7017_g1_i2.p1  ORF type:complete len:658 (-),score=163.07 c7017_g1_i2:105-2078(-)